MPSDTKDNKEDEIPQPPKDWDRCHFFVKHKHRFCKQHPDEFYASKDEPRYCGNHAHLYKKQQGRKRVPCPIDPSHHVYEDQVAKHVLICPRAKRLKMEEQNSSYRKNVNIGGHGQKGFSSDDDKTEISVEEAKRLAKRIIKAYQRVFHSDATNSESFNSVTLEQMQKSIPMMDLSKDEMEAELPQSVEHYRMKSGGERHLLQQASLVGHMRRIGAIPKLNGKKAENNEEDLGILELGAGRGMLGLVAAGTAAASPSSGKVQLIFVEKAGSRSKADTLLRALKRFKADTRQAPPSYLNLEKLNWLRVQCDLAHVYMPTVLVELNEQNKKLSDKKADESDRSEDTTKVSEKSRLVAVAKHLCGAGTDLALRSLQGVSNQVDACVMATCCHGLCNWNDYVGRDFLCRELSSEKNDGGSFSEKEFQLMCRWTSGTVIVDRSSQKAKTKVDDEQTEHSAVEIDDARNPCSINAIVAELELACGRKGLGRACQRLIDKGRCEYLERELFQREEGEAIKSSIEMFHYVPPTVTPQNAVLVAHNMK